MLAVHAPLSRSELNSNGSGVVTVTVTVTVDDVAVSYPVFSLKHKPLPSSDNLILLTPLLGRVSE